MKQLEEAGAKAVIEPGPRLGSTSSWPMLGSAGDDMYMHIYIYMHLQTCVHTPIYIF